MTIYFNPEQRRYFLVEGGEILEALTLFRKNYIATRKTWRELAVKHDLKKFSLSPDGTRVVAAKRSTEEDVVEGGFCEQFVPLPDIREYLSGFPLIDRVVYAVGDEEKQTTIGDAARPFFLDWFSEDGAMMLAVPDPALVCAGLKRQHLDVVFHPSVYAYAPEDIEGLREITLDEWDEIEKQARVIH